MYKINKLPMASSERRPENLPCGGVSITNVNLTNSVTMYQIVPNGTGADESSHLARPQLVGAAKNA